MQTRIYTTSPLDSCVDTIPKPRTSVLPGRRVQEARELYGSSSSNSSPATTVSAHSTPSALESYHAPSRALRLRLADGRDATSIALQLVRELSNFRISRYPLLRWLELPGPFADPDFDFYTLDIIDQALYLTLAALAARCSSAKDFVGIDAPSLRDNAHTPAWRKGTFLCSFGDKREKLATEFLQLSLQKIKELQLFALPSLRSTVCLTVAEILILGYRDIVAYSRIASREARCFSAAAAAHMRAMSEEHFDDQRGSKGYTGWLSVSWTLVVRDALIASATGRSLN